MKKNNIVYIIKSLLPAAVFLCGTVRAQQQWTLEACRKMALENSRNIAAAEKTEEKAGYEAKSYLSNFFPRISASAAYLYTDASISKSIPENYLPTFIPDPATGQLKPNIMTTPDGLPVTGPDGKPVFREYAFFPGMKLDLGLNGTYFAGLCAEQPLFTGGKITSAYRMSLAGRDITRLNRQLTRAEIIVETDEAYWLCLKAIESHKVALAFRRTVNELLQNVDDACRAGMKTKNDMLKVQVQANRAELQVQQAEHAIRLSKLNLCRVTGISQEANLALAESLDAGGDDVLRTTDFTARPEYTMLRKQVELKTRQVQLVRSDFLPQAGIAAGYGYTNGPKLNGAPIFNRVSFSALVTVTIPVFHWGEGMNKIRAAKAEKQIAQLQQDDMSEKMALELRQALDRCEESTLEVSMTARALEQAEENMRTSRDHYEAGMETLAAYLEAQTLWQQAWLDMIQARTDRRLHETYYLKAAGLL
ncbi:MAG: TolC family protein [Tannerella sp.]|jgi:outer membrane protein TolC|nr:TolC family protein [Tannerella sp.]